MPALQPGAALISAALMAGLSSLAGPQIPGLPYAGTGHITGVVTNEVTGEPVARASVIVRLRGAKPSDPTAPTQTDERGRFRSPGLVAGEYTLEAWPPDRSDLVRILYAARPCDYTGCLIAEGSPVRVVDGADTTDINVALPLGGQISGVVRIAATGVPLPWVRVTASTTRFRAYAVTDNGGRYAIKGLITGAYVVEARSAWEGAMGAPRSLWNDLESLAIQYYSRTATRADREEQATPVPVSAPAAVTGIDFALVRK